MIDSVFSAALLLMLGGLVGFGLRARLHAEPREQVLEGPPLVLWLAAGIAGLGLGTFWLDLVGLRPGWGAAIVMGLAAGLVGAARWRRCGWTRTRTRPAWTKTDVAFGSLLVPVVILVLVVMLGRLSTPISSWDAVHLWAFKARILMTESILEPITIVSPQYTTLHPNYPLLLPYLSALGAVMAGNRLDGGLLGATLLLNVLLPFLVYVGVRQWLRPGLAMVLVAIYLTIGPLLAEVGSGTADLPLAALYTALIVAALAFQRQPGRETASIFGLLAAALAFTKNEGLPYALIVFLALGISMQIWRHADLRRSYLLAFFVFSVAVLPWLYVRAGLPAVDEDYPSRIPYIVDALAGGRLKGVLSGFFTQMNLRAWHGLWLLPVAAAFVGHRRWRSPSVVLLALALVGNVALLMAVFLVAPEAVAGALEILLRLLVQFAALPVLLAAALVGGVTNEKAAEEAASNRVASASEEPAGPEAVADPAAGCLSGRA